MLEKGDKAQSTMEGLRECTPALWKGPGYQEVSVREVVVREPKVLHEVENMPGTSGLLRGGKAA